MSAKTPEFPAIPFKSRENTAALPAAAAGGVVISIRPDRGDKADGAANLELLREALRLLPPGELLWLYGQPAELARWGECLRGTPEFGPEVVFKYWIAIALDRTPSRGFLPPAHWGLLLFQRRDPARKTPPPFRIETDPLRIPHRACSACGQTLKDWGGKKHLMNPLGAAPSDVWRLPLRDLTDGLAPDDVLARVQQMLPNSGRLVHLVNAKVEPAVRAVTPPPARKTSAKRASAAFDRLARIELDHVYAGDCLEFMHRVEVLHPNGFFDLAFADPPYNLAKAYGQWDDALADQHYLDWCNDWLAGMAATLKPGGSLFVLNLPKWAMSHATFLQPRLDLQHWIVWDALSDPRGKLMPAHYALLWFTKPGGKPVCNYSPMGAKPKPGFVAPPDAPEYCLRAKCVQQRKARGLDAKVELTDIWSDIHRIKHKRDRDAHPCQLPDKLMDRILRLATRPGDVVFDPFCGAGTTAIAARKLGRHFVVTELDETYVRITREKLAAMQAHADLFGEFVVPRQSVVRKRDEITKREIESFLQDLARTLQREPTEADVQAERPGLLAEIDRIYPNRGAAFKRAKIALAAR
jgi:DNA modification methylase